MEGNLEAVEGSAMQIAPVIARIKSQVTVLANRVQLATSLEAITADGIKGYPCAYLFTPAERADANALLNYISQRMEDTFGVLLIVRNVSDSRGDAAYAELDALRPLLRTALLGWTYADGVRPIECVGGELLYAKDGLVIWNDKFKTDYYARAPYV